MKNKFIYPQIGESISTLISKAKATIRKSKNSNAQYLIVVDKTEIPINISSSEKVISQKINDVMYPNKANS